MCMRVCVCLCVCVCVCDLRKKRSKEALSSNALFFKRSCSLSLCRLTFSGGARASIVFSFLSIAPQRSSSSTLQKKREWKKEKSAELYLLAPFSGSPAPL